jgi:hypothetical protein
VALESQTLCRLLAGGSTVPPPAARLQHPLVVVDLSAVYHSPALPVVTTCVAAWLQAVPSADNGTRRMVVVDESWRRFSHLPIAAWMQQSFKLSRASGTMNVLVMHRLSDLASAGAAGSHQVRLAEGLLADTETRVIYLRPARVGSGSRPRAPRAVRHRSEASPQLPAGRRCGRWGIGHSWSSIAYRRPKQHSRSVMTWKKSSAPRLSSWT